MTRSAWLLLVTTLTAACGGKSGRAQVPQKPPQTLSMIADEPGTGGPSDELREPVGLRASTDPVRRDACGVPLAVSIEGLMTDQGIRRVQERLVERGLLERGAFRPGELDAPTLAAVRDLQRREGLPPVGLPNYATVRSLELEASAVFISGDPDCEDES